ncbi:Gfo/Idh/MocA family protein [Paenibacillus glycinis]|uniref:Gfo/Idh/MocA family oxidoreductase n=1 Tax=Paenibacillus glycinis TaxID=2697035 RepID=A0ABW9XNJ3_9BACL|nr:Gfo/Idh/MocA family oxidoreductase [Paenibacillus glycinis]NBD24210.1 Gfo/Idh/MocA family oxidoreductase [Paenibacillus glycinis]
MKYFAIVGCGHIANKHIEAIARTEGAELLALCDTNQARLDDLRAVTTAKLYTDMAAMLQAEPRIDVICICTPSGLHASLAIQAAQAGKHLIIEKPISLTLADADAIIEAVASSGVKAAVVHPNRYRPAMKQLKRALEEENFGKLSHVNATVRWNRNQAYYDQAPWRGTKLMDGGVLMNQAIHNLDLLLWLFGPVAKVKSIVDTRIRDIEAEDVAVAALKFESGALGTVEAATTIFDKNLEESIGVFGEYGYAIVGGKTANWIKEWKSSKMTQDQIESLIRDIEHDPFGVSGHQCIIEDMVRAIDEGRSPAVTVEDGKRAIQLVIDIVDDGYIG